MADRKTTRYVEVRTWGRSGLGNFSVRVDDETSAVEAARRSIARRSGLEIATCRSDGTALDKRGEPESHHYHVTLGAPVPREQGGGWSVKGELWFAIPASEPTPVGTDAGAMAMKHIIPPMADVLDVPYEEASNVASIRYRLHPLDTGRNLRAEGAIIPIDPASDPIRISYAALTGERRVISGPREAVLSRLRAVGYQFLVPNILRHTPGPWVIGAGAPGTHIVRGARPTEDEGNRSLIRAAPDLFAALQEVLGAAYDAIPPDLRARATAALASASGLAAYVLRSKPEGRMRRGAAP